MFFAGVFMAITSQLFGSAHTERKLQAVQAYLNAFTTALKKQSFDLMYVDACAGSGSSAKRQDIQQASLIEADDIIEGSAVRALQIPTKFDRYVFNDAKRKNTRSLEATVADRFPEFADRVTVMQLDANKALVELCNQTDWKKSRAVVFLDPFGLQLNFSMVSALGATGAIDLWYLVPVLGMSRQVKSDGSILEPGGSRVDELLGTTDWRSGASVTEQGETDLFGVIPSVVTRVANSAWFESIAIRQLRSVFKGGVLDTTLPLGRGGLHEFSLVFACANPRPQANELAKRLAAAVLK
jgi:three-Cys-motif partner protein